MKSVCRDAISYPLIQHRGGRLPLCQCDMRQLTPRNYAPTRLTMDVKSATLERSPAYFSQQNGSSADSMCTMNRRFPGYSACIAMMRKHSPQVQEDGFYALLPHAADHVDALMLDFRQEADHGLRCWFLDLIGEAKSPRAFEFLREQLESSDESFRNRALVGLQRLGTPEARQALFDASAGRGSRRTSR